MKTRLNVIGADLRLERSERRALEASAESWQAVPWAWYLGQAPEWNETVRLIRTMEREAMDAAKAQWRADMAQCRKESV